MTTATASARGRSNMSKGKAAERAVARWLRENGWPQADRAVRTGYRSSLRTSDDPGDIVGTPGLAWQVKDCGTLTMVRLCHGVGISYPPGRRKEFADPGSRGFPGSNGTRGTCPIAARRGLWKCHGIAVRNGRINPMNGAGENDSTALPGRRIALERNPT